jgi:serine/threonine-protein kinase
MADQFPEKFGKYKIIEEVGRGGFAAVYKAVDTTLDRTVALKVLAPHLLWDPTFVQRFQREAKVAANLDHPNIVTIHEVSQIEGVYFIAMQFLEGRTLSQILEAEGPLPVSQVQAIIEQIASALDYAHVRGFVHRDIKPSNIIVADDGQATLTDFGLVKAGEGTKLSTTGVVFGTPEYMSPEQAEGKALDTRSDIYSVGVVLFEMLAGRAPFVADTTPAVMYKHVHEPPPLDELPSDLPQGVVAVIEKALAKDPTGRFQTVAEIVGALRRTVLGPEPEVAPSALVEPVAVPEEEAVPIWQKVPVWGWAAIGGMVLLTAVAGAFLAGRGVKPVPTLMVVAQATTPAATSAAMPRPTATPAAPTFTALPPTATPVPTVTPAPSTDTPVPSMATKTPTQTPVPPTATGTHTPRSPTPTPVPTAVPPPAGRIALTIYLRDTLTETGFAALSGDQPNGGMIYEEGKFVYGEAAVQIGDTVYHFDKPEVGPGEPEQLPDPWRVEFEFAEDLVTRTGNRAGFDPKKAQFWVGALNSESAIGEESPYGLTMKLYEGNELRGSIQVFFAVKDTPVSGGPGAGEGPYPSYP